MLELVAFARGVRGASAASGRRTDESWDDLRALKARLRQVDARG